MVGQIVITKLEHWTNNNLKKQWCDEHFKYKEGDIIQDTLGFIIEITEIVLNIDKYSRPSCYYIGFLFLIWTYVLILYDSIPNIYTNLNFILW